MTDNDLVALIRSHRRDSLGVEDGDLSSERADAMDHYHGRPYGNEVVGRSQIVSRDLAEAVDWALPAIMRAFTHSGSIGAFDPIGPEDEQGAEQESDYVNHVLMKDNNGFMLLHDVFKDAMLLKNGYAKHFWDVQEEVKEEEYSGLSMEALQQLIGELEYDGSTVEITGQDSQTIEIPGVGPLEVFDVKLRVRCKTGKLVAIPVPAEEVRVSKRCRGSLQDSPFTEHVTKKTRSELIEMGMDRDFVDQLPAYGQNDNDAEKYARDSLDEESTDQLGQALADRSMDEIEFCEAFIRLDYDGDGVAELRKVVTCANRIPPGPEWNEPIEAVPMTTFVMKRVPHRHVGESFDDELSDLQEIKTTLQRQLLDNVYATNNNQWLVNERVNLPDFLTSLPGGVKRIRGDGPIADSVQPVMAKPIVGDLLPVIEHFDRNKETRTGIRPGSDMDPDMLREVTKGAYLEGLNRLSQKVEMITRLLAEGVKELFLQSHAILSRHQDRAKMVKLRGKWIEVNPREWKNRTDMTVKVGLGTGNEEEKRQKLSMLAQMQMQLLQTATAAPPPVYAKMYALFEDMAKAMGFEMPEKYGISPNGPEMAQLQQMKQQQPNPEMAKLQAETQLEQAKMQMQQQVDANRQQMEAQQQQARMTMEMELERAKAQMQMELERERMKLKAEVDLMIARMNNAAKLDAAQITAQTTLTTQQEAASDNAAQD